MVVVEELVPLTGRSVPFAVPSAAAGLSAATASTKLERKMSLRSGIPATPFWVPRPSACAQTARGPALDETERRPSAVASQAFDSSAADGNPSSPPYASLCARGDFLNWGQI